MSDINEIKNKLRERSGKKPIDFSILNFGKVPPQARDLEEAVLGAMMLEKNAVTQVLDILNPDSFYIPAHGEIFRAMNQLFMATKPIDMLTVTEQLRSNGKLEEVGGAFYITQLTDKIATGAHSEYYARIIVQKYIQRELIRISSEVIRDAYEEITDVFELLDNTEKQLYEIASKNLKRDFTDMSTLIFRSMEYIEKLKDNELGINLGAVPSGFTALDRLTSGWQKSDLIICAARPGMGKTAFVLSLARNAAVMHKRPVAIFSLEMSALQLVNRLLSGEAELSSEKLRKGDLEPYEWQQLQTKTAQLAEAPIFIDDSAQINIFELRAKCRRLKQQHNIEMVIIDYLQLMHGNIDANKGMNREQEIGNISRNLKALAKELEIPVIAIAQLSRAPEIRGGTKRPMLSDLRESGSIEQDADMVLFLYRPEYYKIDIDANGNSLKGIAEIIIGKHRNGATGSVFTKFVDKYSKFQELDPIIDGTHFDINSIPNKDIKNVNYTTKGSKANDIANNNDYDDPF